MMHTHSAPAPTPAAVPAFSPDRWLYQLFSPLAVATGRTLRRDVAEVAAQMDRARFEAEVRLRGYRLREVAGEYLLDPVREPLRVMI